MAPSKIPAKSAFVRCGFARVRYSACRSEHLLAFSCKRRYFCPSCHQKRVVLFAERIEQEVLERIPVRQYVVTIPKMLRIFFKHDRKLLGLLSQCFYQTIKQFLQEVYPERQAVPGMIVSIQTYGDDLMRFHPHLHCLVSDGLFLTDGSFLPVAAPEPETLMRAFRHKLLKALLGREIITPQRVELLLSWQARACLPVSTKSKTGRCSMDIPLDKWSLNIEGLVEKPLLLTWPEFIALPQIEKVTDFHCVTTWSRFDNHWKGVEFKTVCDLVKPKPEARYVLFTGYDGYSTNLPLDVVSTTR